jgi:hypothetical protein
MTHVAHACVSCGSLTIFAAEASYPRRCAHCSRIVHASPAQSRDTVAVLQRLASRARLAAARPRSEDEAESRTSTA